MRLLKNMAGDMGTLLRRLWPLAVVALFAELGYAVMNVGALPYYLKEPRPVGLGVSTTLIGLIISTFLIAETSCKALFGWAGDRYGRKYFIVFGLCLSGLTPLLMRLADEPWAFFPLRAVDGIGAAALWPCIFASVASLTTDEERNGAMSVFNMMYMIGLALALPVYSWVIGMTGHHHDVFLIISLVFLLAAGLAALAVPKTKDPTHAGEGVAKEGAAAVGEPIGWREVMELATGSRLLAAMLLASLLQAVGTNLLSGVISIYALEQLGIHPESIGKVFIGPGIAVLALALPLGWLGGRWGKLRSIWLGLITAMVAMFLFPFADSLLMFSIIAVPFVVGFLIAAPAWLALVTQMAPPGQQGLIVGAIATAQGVGAMIGPALGGWLYEHVRPSAPFYVSSVLLLFALITVVREFREDMRVELPSKSRGD